ncbi:MAG: hypothetical protein Q8S18_06030, partial [Bacteroidales bacterium]|nr:hypothetical protein [Bacteroidales bacterium]
AAKNKSNTSADGYPINPLAHFHPSFMHHPHSASMPPLPPMPRNDNPNHHHSRRFHPSTIS